MDHELTGNEEGLVGYWKFNEGAGDSIFDSTPNGNHGQLGSAPGPDASDPAWITHEFPTLPVSLFLSPSGPTVVPRGDILEFTTRIENNRDNTVEGDYWLSVLLPDSNEVLVPDELLNFPNPLSGQILSFDFVDLSNWLFVPMRADTGSYDLIGRIGQYPDVVIDEEGFGFRVVE